MKGKWVLLIFAVLVALIVLSIFLTYLPRYRIDFFAVPFPGGVGYTRLDKWTGEVTSTTLRDWPRNWQEWERGKGNDGRK